MLIYATGNRAYTRRFSDSELEVKVSPIGFVKTRSISYLLCLSSDKIPYKVFTSDNSLASVLPDSACKLIDLILGADLGTSEIDFELLSKVVQFSVQNVIAEGSPRNPFAASSVTSYQLVFEDSSTSTVFVYSVGYPEGYHFNLYLSKEKALADFLDN